MTGRERERLFNPKEDCTIERTIVALLDLIVCECVSVRVCLALMIG